MRASLLDFRRLLAFHTTNALQSGREFKRLFHAKTPCASLVDSFLFKHGG
ncbi:MAG: hypothetical protein WCY84_05055 [Candidatus Cloacimonadaceae bacterium]